MKVQAKVNTTGSMTREYTRVDEQIYTTGLSVIGISSCAIGLWAFACLVGGLIASGGPLALVTNWAKAVFGV
jgi:hypothetical protein